MKNKLLYLGIGALTIAMASCSNDYLESLTTSTAKQKGLITATVENNGAATRVGFESDGKFYWTAGDKIGIASSATSVRHRTTFVPLTLAEGGAGKATASFEGEYERTINDYAIYPYYKDGTTEHEIDIYDDYFTLYYHLPKSYTYDGVDTDFFSGATTKKQSFNPPMYGKIETDDEGNSSIDFKYLGGVICVKVPKIPVSSGALVVTSPDSDDYPLAGDFRATNYNGKTPVLDPSPSAENFDNVTINFSGAEVGKDAVFYIPAPPLTFSTITIKLVDDADNPTKIYAAEERSNVTVDRGMLYGIILDETSVSKDGDAMISTTVSSVDDVYDALAKDDNAAVTLTYAGAATYIKIPAVTSSSNSTKKLTINKVESDAYVEIKDANDGDSDLSVKNMTIALPSWDAGEAKIYMANSTVTLASSTEATSIDGITASTADNTLIIEKDVKIKYFLYVISGNVIVKNGATVGAIYKHSTNTSDKVYVTVEDGGTVSTYGDNVYDVSNITTYDALNNALTYEGELSLKLGDDITITETVEVKGNKKLDFNGHKIIVNRTSSSTDGGLSVAKGASITLEGESGGIYVEDNTSHGVYVEGGNLTVNGGITIQGCNTCVFVYGGTAYINGGVYMKTGSSKSYDYLLCVIMGDMGEEGLISVTGGTFYGFNPVGYGDIKIQDGYESQKTGTYQDGDTTIDIYTVSPTSSSDDGD